MDVEVMEAPETNETSEHLDAAASEQMEVAQIKRKQRVTATVSKITLGGAIMDIGLDKPGFIHLARITEDPINRVEDVLEVGQTVDAWVLRADPHRPHVELTMIEPLKYDWRDLKKGMVVSGQVTRIEKYGVFVEIGAERPGMIHVSELAHKFVRNPHEVVSIGDEVEARVLAVHRRKKQIKLSMKALRENEARAEVFPTAQEALEENNKPDVAVPTAMEMALRQAMKRSKGELEDDKPKKSKARSAELENILSRTLESYTPPK